MSPQSRHSTGCARGKSRNRSHPIQVALAPKRTYAEQQKHLLDGLVGAAVAWRVAARLIRWCTDWQKLQNPWQEKTRPNERRCIIRLGPWTCEGDEAFAEPLHYPGRCAESSPKPTFFETPQICRMRNHLSSSLRNNPRLTAEEFASLQEVRNRPSQRTIPDEHRDRLIELGYIRAVVPSHEGISALALTGRGLRRLALGK